MNARKRSITIADLRQRLIGFSTTLLSKGWKPSIGERDAVRSLLVFLEDRRVLFNPFHLEVEYQVRQSIQQIREQCNAAIGTLPEASPAIAPLRGIRAACHRFLNEPRGEGRHFHQRDFGPEGPEFFTALGEFRATIGA